MLLRQGGGEVLQQQGQVPKPFPQWGQQQRDHVEPVIEIGAKLSRLDHLVEVAVGGGNHPHIHHHRGRFPEPLTLSRLQEA